MNFNPRMLSHHHQQIMSAAKVKIEYIQDRRIEFMCTRQEEGIKAKHFQMQFKRIQEFAKLGRVSHHRPTSALDRRLLSSVDRIPAARHFLLNISRRREGRFIHTYVPYVHCKYGKRQETLD
jgi:hypothetical protein